jgi:hypothetical protein
VKDQPRVYPKGYFACQNNGSQIIAGQYAPAYCDGYLPSRYLAYPNIGSQNIMGQYASAYCDGYLPSRYNCNYFNE